MKLTSSILTEQHAKEISSWKYEKDYALYNLPTWEEMQQQNYALCDPVKRQHFRSYLNEQDELMGFINLLDEADWVFLGIGVHPKHCSKGIGRRIINMAIKESQFLYPNKSLRLEVRTWNERAIKCYQSQQFKIIEKKQQETYLGLGEFYIMKYIHHKK